ncbi:hypothetical protein EIP91_002508 [Steccherinum ochraceum]|uniref:Uncharacterized protein n=1 Tax=Steccherinum ochraceum TaxID=92696 RepID=A0A4R0RST2_9APHY|nr:hypothetical protein EIP91_002508 [Steccherinum ochraceum]
MPKSTSEVASTIALKSRSNTPYASSSSARTRRVTFQATEQDEGHSSDTDDADNSSVEEDVEPDIRSMFARRIRNWPENKIREFEDRMRAPYDLSPIPSRRNSQDFQYYFGYYITASEIRKFSERYNSEWPKDPNEMPPDAGAFLEYMLSFAMLGGREVKLRRAWVREEDKERLSSIEEPVGKGCYVVVVLSMTDYQRGYRPRYVEVRELTKMMRRKPSWWQGVF